MDIKQEDPLPDNVGSQSEREFFFVEVRMNRNTDAVLLDDECNVVIKSEHLIEQSKCETVTFSNTDSKADFGSQNDGEFLPENPDKYNFDHEMDNKIEIKGEPCWMETGASAFCYDEDFPPVKSSRLCPEAVSDDSGSKLLLYSAETSRRETAFYNGKNYFECESQENDFTKMPTVEKDAHSEQSLYQCKTCDKSYTKPSYLITHNWVHKDRKPHQCKICNKSFTQISTLKTHNLIHEGKSPYQCKTCHKGFAALSNLKRHNLIHEGKKAHQCKSCDKSFIRSPDLKRHNLIHEAKKLHQCKSCDKNFTHLSGLKRHNLVHEGKKPHQCKTCDKSFTDLSSLNRHNLIHEDEKPHQCKSCDKSFTDLSSFKRHNLIHEGKKPYHCKICDKRFTDVSNYKRHSLIHEGKNPHQDKT